MGWFDNWKADDSVREIKHVRGAKIQKSLPKKQGPRYYDPGDPATHDLPQKPDRGRKNLRKSNGWADDGEFRFVGILPFGKLPVNTIYILREAGIGRPGKLVGIEDCPAGFALFSENLCVMPGICGGEGNPGEFFEKFSPPPAQIDFRFFHSVGERYWIDADPVLPHSEHRFVDLPMKLEMKVFRSQNLPIEDRIVQDDRAKE